MKKKNFSLLQLSPQDLLKYIQVSSTYYDRLSKDIEYDTKDKTTFQHKKKIIFNRLGVKNNSYELYFTKNTPVIDKMRQFKGVWDVGQIVGYGSQAVIVRPKRGLVDKFVLKYPTKMYNSDESITLTEANIEVEENTIHELFISVILNEYSTNIPNIVNFRGMFKAHRPVFGFSELKICPDIDSNGKPNKEVLFSIYDYVKGKTLNEEFESTYGDPTLYNILNWYLQLLLTLASLERLNFSHNDLHPNNIILRPLNKSTNIQYNLEHKQWTLKADQIATMIDFSCSYLELDGVKYGVYYMYTDHVYHDRPNKLSDAFKIFISMAFLLYYEHRNNPKLRKKRLDVFKSLEPIFKFFIKANFEEYIKDIKVYTLPHIFDLNYKHQHLIEYIQFTYPKIVKKFMNIM